MQNVDALMAKAFFEGREPRSPEYKRGVRSVLLFRIEGCELEVIPYAPGTAQADAYLAGRQEGNIIWRATTSESKPSSQ